MPFRPASLAVRAYDTVFRQIPVDDAWLEAVRAAAARGPIVHVLRNVSLVDLLTLEDKGMYATMSGGGAKDLRDRFTRYGKRLVKYIAAGEVPSA